MNLGLGNLIELKRQLLAADLVSGDDWDAKIEAIGKGVAGLLQRHCNRLFERVAGAQDFFTADRRSWVAARFPVESISAVDQQDTVLTGYVTLGAVNSVVVTWDAPSGLVEFGDVLGNYTSLVRLTYTGGYWFDTTEDGSGVQPVGSTLVPDDLKLAWHLQCKKVWEVYDPIGRGLAKTGNEGQLLGLSLAGLELLPQARELLQPHLRFQIT
jgi:hypothetical protein